VICCDCLWLCVSQGTWNSLNFPQSGLERAGWVPKDNFRLALRFIGEVLRMKAEEIVLALGQIRLPPFEMKLGEAGSVFPW
jgi:2'-5' RNA ligase